MPSPFPGMDPCLEGNCWTSFHAELAPTGGFDLAVDYRRPPEVELSAPEDAWLDEHQCAEGLRR